MTTYENFLWNFQLTSFQKSTIAKISVNNYPDEDNCKWEKRYFWPENANILLGDNGENVLNLYQYKFKTHNDIYILCQNNKSSLKIRDRKLSLKPLLKIEDDCFSYGKKITFAEIEDIKQFEQRAYVLQVLKDNNFEVDKIKFLSVYKEVFFYTEQKKIKLEFSRVKVNQTCYLSFAIEAKNIDLLKEIAEFIKPNESVRDYPSFLMSLR